MRACSGTRACCPPSRSFLLVRVRVRACARFCCAGIIADADFMPMVDRLDKNELDIRCSKHMYTIWTEDHRNERKMDWIYQNIQGATVSAGQGRGQRVHVCGCARTGWYAWVCGCMGVWREHSGRYGKRRAGEGQIDRSGGVRVRPCIACRVCLATVRAAVGTCAPVISLVVLLCPLPSAAPVSCERAHLPNTARSWHASLLCLCR